ncbi:hypothetical protein NP493_8439g00000 [Ridgeia piscesae]|uniref:Cytochrome c oxidase assembly factor 5 n=1 Tax=Ridgeia piscesae TaxID=27915 RepID=A0AAD9IQ14_RIDPI|nr:hypothetical protein NP493_8439g00000 [Ridgeia piscesae]
MPRYYEEGELEKQNACDGLRADLKECLRQSDCVMKDRRTPKECLLMGLHPSVPEECHRLRSAFFECKRSLVGSLIIVQVTDCC